MSYNVVLVKGFSSTHVPNCTYTGASIAVGQYYHCTHTQSLSVL